MVGHQLYDLATPTSPKIILITANPYQSSLSYPLCSVFVLHGNYQLINWNVGYITALSVLVPWNVLQVFCSLCLGVADGMYCRRSGDLNWCRIQQYGADV